MRPALQARRDGDADLRCPRLTADAVGAGRADRQGHSEACRRQGQAEGGDQEREGAAAKRRGASLQEAEAEVLCRRVKLPLPTPAEIAAVWRQIEKEAARGAAARAPLAARAATATDASVSSTPEPRPAPAPASAPAPAPATAPAPEAAVQLPPGAVAASTEQINQLLQCPRVGKAIRHAMTVEAFIPAPKVYFEDSDESDSETDSEADEEAEVATVRYKARAAAARQGIPAPTVWQRSKSARYDAGGDCGE